MHITSLVSVSTSPVLQCACCAAHTSRHRMLLGSAIMCNAVVINNVIPVALEQYD